MPNAAQSTGCENDWRKKCNGTNSSEEHVAERGDWAEFWEWYSNLEKDDELADNIE